MEITNRKNHQNGNWAVFLMAFTKKTTTAQIQPTVF